MVIFFSNRAAEILYAITQTYSAHEESAYIDLIKARRNLALHQHHDGITGTSKNEVAIDFQNRMLSAIQTSIKIMESSIFFLMNKSKSSKEDKSITHEKARKGLKPIKRIFNVNNYSSVIIVYNPLAQERVQVVSIIMSQPFVKVNSYLFIFTFMWKHLLRAALKKKLPWEKPLRDSSLLRSRFGHEHYPSSCPEFFKSLLFRTSSRWMEHFRNFYQ